LRADEALVQRGLAESRAKAKALIMAGDVLIGDRPVSKPAELVDLDAELLVKAPPRFVSRGGFKLEHALDTFGIDVRGRVAVDIGASTGGFTDCLLQRGAARVYAIDVGYGQLDYRLRQDQRVVVLERVNARDLRILPEAVDMVAIDVSFISLRLIWPAAIAVAKSDADIVALIKPQFEAGRDLVNRRGVVTDERTRLRVVADVVAGAGEVGLSVRGLTKSPIIGPAGNVEFLSWFSRVGAAIDVQCALERLAQETG
jgi:23S rRNA (cytidine1920-2'-O)/16S rRNA (cytidine1409-2'-O)-methyltransferase